MKIIALTQRTTHIEEYAETRDCLDQRWLAFFKACQFIPLILPNHFDSATLMLKHFKVDGIMLTGGNDDDARAKLEKHLIMHCEANALPLLGVCHGMQAIQQFYGIDMVDVHGHVLRDQVIHFENSTMIRDSYHCHGTTETSDELAVLARASDGVVKAIKHQTRPMAGIMWHPERSQPFHQADVSFVKQFFEEAKACEPLS